jgi:hypothetical protein
MIFVLRSFLNRSLKFICFSFFWLLARSVFLFEIMITDLYKGLFIISSSLCIVEWADHSGRAA